MVNWRNSLLRVKQIARFEEGREEELDSYDMEILLIHTMAKHSKAMKVSNMSQPNLFKTLPSISKKKIWQMIGKFGKWSYKYCEADPTAMSGQVHFKRLHVHTLHFSRTTTHC